MNKLKYLSLIAVIATAAQAIQIKSPTQDARTIAKMEVNTCDGGFRGMYNKNISCSIGKIKEPGLSDGWLELTAAGNDLYLYANPSLTNIDALSNLTSVKGSLFLDSNPSMANLNGLKGLKRVGWILNVCNNKSLTDVSGLANLNYIGNAVYFENKEYVTKLPADSYLCKNYGTRIHFHNIGMAKASTKSQVCNQ